MAYSDYGAFVWKNGERRTDKEDAPLFASDEDTFGADIGDIPSGARIWVSLLQAKETGRKTTWLTAIHHGILGDGPVRVLCHKYGLPEIWEMADDGPHEVVYHDDSVFSDTFGSYRPVSFEYKGYTFRAEAGDSIYYAIMIEPDGTEWNFDTPHV